MSAPMPAPAPAPPPHLSPGYPSSNSTDKRPDKVSKAIPHIKDLAVKAESQVDRQASIGKLLERAEQAAKQAKSLLGFGRTDYAFIEHIVATTIISTVIPRHKDYASLQTDHPRLFAQNRELIKRLNQDRSLFDAVEEAIKHDNQRTGVQSLASAAARNADLPRSAHSDRSTPDPFGPSKDHSPARPTSYVSSSESTHGRRLDSPTSGYRNSSYVPNTVSPTPNGRAAPSIHPKPQSLHGMVISSNGHQTTVQASGVGGDSLNERFQRLRTANGQNDSPKSPDQHHSVTASQSSYRSPKVPVSKYRTGLPTELQIGYSTGLPKPPSPTYSPARSLKAETPTEASGHAASMMSSTDRVSPYAARNGGHVFDHVIDSYPTTERSYRQSDSSMSSAQSSRPRRREFTAPRETEISAEQLYDYLKAFNVLLIDVRSREEYDSGHIFASFGMCIEPAALRPNQSAEELFESLVLSPESEQLLFDKRDEFDLIVYYDECSTATNPPPHEGPRNLALSFLHDALYEYNQEKPLGFPPVLLIGGIQAWSNLCGPHALKESDTAAAMKAKRAMTPRPRRPLPKDSSYLPTVQKKRHRDYNPLAPEEERKWRERARSETHVLDAQTHHEDSEEPVPPERPAFLEEYNEFERRYPDVATVEVNRMMQSPPARPAPEPRSVSQVPTYPTPPVPTVPSRPPPAVPRPSYSGISERVQAQMVSSARPPTLAPYIPPKLKRLPRTGLHNFGVTCYMNATIQCLSATIPLTAFFLDNQYIKYIQRDNWKGSKGIMSELYNILLRNLWESHDVDTIRPTNFRKFCARLNKEWGIDRQQDAKEFLEFLVDTLHEDLNTNWARTILRPLTAKEEAERERTPHFLASNLEWNRYTHRDHSRLTDMFAGQHISRLQCTTCRMSSTTYEAFYSISVEIPSRPTTGSRPLNIHDCLRSYCSAETLSGEEVWRCPHCKREREATKRITITRAPEFLVIHFKRFSASHSERARKVHTPIDFPLKGLDLEPYMLPPPESSAAATEQILARKDGDTLLRDKPASMRAPYRYDAYAVMRHIGATMTSGHYISLVQDKARGCWREFNDDAVTDFKPADLPGGRRLQNEQAYIVFYQRVHD